MTRNVMIIINKNNHVTDSIKNYKNYTYRLKFIHGMRTILLLTLNFLNKTIQYNII